MKLKVLFAAAAGYLLCASHASAAENSGEVYGPAVPEGVAPREPQEKFDYPVQFTVLPEESVEDAKDKVRRKRRDATRWEIAYQVLNVVDAVQTVDCTQRGVCAEGNPAVRAVFGRKPDPVLFGGTKVAFGVVHWLVFAKKRRDNPDSARSFARWSVAVQGSVVVLNARFTF